MTATRTNMLASICRHRALTPIAPRLAFAPRRCASSNPESVQRMLELYARRRKLGELVPPSAAEKPRNTDPLARKLHTLVCTWCDKYHDIADLDALVAENTEDAELAQSALEDRVAITESLAHLQSRIVSQILALNESEGGNGGEVVLEIRPGTGGDEATLFAREMFDMYRMYAALQGWRFESVTGGGGASGSTNEEGAAKTKESVATITGDGVYGRLSFETGVHRVQRVPVTETKGRVHTSTITIAVLPQPTETDVVIRDADLKIDFYRSGGPGGQSVNTTDSAVRITHTPSGLVVAMQDERSQHKNKAKALKLLRARLFDHQRSRLEAERRGQRNVQIGTGDRSEKIRTYNYGQNRVTDHRVAWSVYDVGRVMRGEALDEFVERLRSRAAMEGLRQALDKAV